MTIRRIRAPGLDLRGLGEALMRWYQTQHLGSDVDEGEGAVVVRCRSRTARNFIGTGLALTVVLRQEGPDLAVEMGAAKWTDKGAVAAVGILTLSAGGVGLIPLGTAAWGAWRQSRLPGQTIEFLKATAPAFMADARFFTPDDFGTTPSPSPATPIDVNSATPEDLSRVPGIDIDLAHRIVENREPRHGFYA